MARREYDALVEKVDAFAQGVSGRREADMACRAGCTGCCHVQLGVSSVEAAAIREHLASLPAEPRSALAARAAGHRPDGPDAPCVMLGDDGRCAIYPARPLVCRTQGLPLLYEGGLVPAEAVLGRSERGDVTWCPLNFTEAPPEPADVLDADRIDQMLALVNRRFVADGRDEEGDPTERIALVTLAEQVAELNPAGRRS